MVEKIFEELGYLSEVACKTLEKVMNGKSFYDFKVKYSNFAGNCTLIVRSENEGVQPDEVGTMFLHCSVEELAHMARMKKILETYIKESVPYKRRILFFKESHQYTAWFSDAHTVSTLLGLRVGKTVHDGYDFIYIDSEKFQQYADYIVERGLAIKVEDMTEYGF